MDGRGISRRTLLRAGAVAIGTTTAGCTLPGDDDRSARLTFESIDDGLRARTETVYERVAALVQSSIREETTIELIDTAEMHERAAGGNVVGETITQRLAHRALGLTETLEPELPFEFAGAYYPGSATIVLVGEDGRDIDDGLLAHELFHAIQFQSAGVTDWERSWSIGFDRYNAQQALVEGAAMFVEDEYVGGCGGDFSSCQLAQPARIDPQQIDPALLLSYGAYFNGHDFADALAARDGWRSIWTAHDDVPISTGQILRPEWYPERRPEPVPIPPNPDDPWTILDTERLGMRALFVTLWTADVLPESTVYTGDEDDTDEVFSELVRYRSPLTDRWRGDAFTGFERSDDSYAWTWRIRWEDAAAAETGYEHFREWADARGSSTGSDGIWERERGYASLALNDEDVLVGMAPELGDFEAIAPILGE